MLEVQVKPNKTIAYHNVEVTMDKKYQVVVKKISTMESHVYEIESELIGDEKRMVEGVVLNHVKKNGI